MRPLIDADVLHKFEYWPEIEDGYYLSPDGKVWSDRSDEFIQGYVGENGYLYYTYYDGRREYAHRLVAFYFVANPRGFTQVNHKDYNRLNNSYDNLEWVSVAENNLHAHQKPGRKKISSYNHPNCKLTKEQAVEIFTSGLPERKLAAMYGVSSRTVHDIKHGVKYGWATKEVVVHAPID